MAGLGAPAKAAIIQGLLGAVHQALMALAIGVTQRCSGCIGFHVKTLHRLQCALAELEDMLAVCVRMGGGPALVCAA
jgi:AhpD family alkylhydroperoxidase